MRFLTSLAALVLVAGFLGTVLPSPAAPTSSPAARTVLVSAPGGRAVGGGTVEPDLFGSWWKVFKKIMGAFIDFIDAVIDATVPGGGNGDDGGDNVARAVTAAAPSGLLS